jgi:predicted phage terminase large subunit-like protein
MASNTTISAHVSKGSPRGTTTTKASSTSAKSVKTRFTPEYGAKRSALPKKTKSAKPSATPMPALAKSSPTESTSEDLTKTAVSSAIPIPEPDPQIELASRILARRRLLPFTQRINPRYLAGWVHEDICRRLEKFSEDVAKGLSPRLMLLMPPRHGKSELSSRMFPAWHLGKFPDHEIIASSYNVGLAMSFSRKVKEVMTDPSYMNVFDTRLNPNFQGAEEWGVDNARGGYVAAGVGGGITGKGAHCLHPETIVSTVEGPLSIERLYLLKSMPDVITPFGNRRVLAATKRPAPHGYVLRFASGAILKATGEHPVFLPDQSRYATVGELYGETQSDGGLNVRVVRESVSAATVRSQQVSKPGIDGVLLQPDMLSSTSCSKEREDLRDVRESSRCSQEKQECKVLLTGMPADAGSAYPQVLPAMLRGVSTKTFHAGLLRGDLRRYGAHAPYAWDEELELSNRQRLRVLVQPDQAIDFDQGQGLRSVREHSSGPALPPHQRGQERQLTRELSDAVQHAPHGAPQISYDTLCMVERDGEVPDFVYDLQVEETGCFFANHVLVGNCLIIDDPIKNAEEADSADNREKLKDWYDSTAYTRLAPGGGVLIVQTWWHDDDLAGRLQVAMAGDPEADQFVVVKYPAIAEADEFLDYDTDLIVSTQPANGKLLRRKGEALHPDRYDIQKLNRIKKTIQPRFWSALYQQNPVPDDGAYFLKENFKRQSLPATRASNVFIAFDFAISEKKQNDYTVGVVALQDDDDILHMADMVRFKSADSFFIVEAILNLTSRWYSPSLVLGFEDGQIYRAIEALLKKRMRERRVYPSIVVLKPISDKMARARPLQGRMQQGMVSFNDKAEWYDECRAEMLRFPAGVHDDQVDALAWATQMAIGREPPRKPKAKEPESWRKKLGSLTSGGSHMTA